MSVISYAALSLQLKDIAQLFLLYLTFTHSLLNKESKTHYCPLQRTSNKLTVKQAELGCHYELGSPKGHPVLPCVPFLGFPHKVHIAGVPAPPRLFLVLVCTLTGSTAGDNARRSQRYCFLKALFS